jgi:putative ABC transport system permease protein
MWKLAVRNVFRHKGRTGMTLLAIVAGVVGLILSGGFVYDIFTQLREVLIHSQLGHIQVATSGYFEHGARSPERFLIHDPGRLEGVIRGAPHVEDVMGRLYFSGLLNNGRADLPIIGEGIEPGPEAKLGSNLTITAGRRLQDGDKFSMMVGHGLAKALKLKPGDRATIVISTAEGAQNTLDVEVVGVFQAFSKDYDARAVRIPLAAAQELLATEGVNTIVVSLKRTEDTKLVAATLAKSLAPMDVDVRSWSQLNDFYSKTVEMYDVQFSVLRFIVLMMVLLSVTNSVNMSVFERVGEFGTMMALGNRGRRVFTLILMENSIIGLAGATVGVLLGIVLALTISAIGIPMPPPPNSDLGYLAHIQIVPTVIAGAFVVGFVATAVAALIPASRIHRIAVVDALRQNV